MPIHTGRMDDTTQASADSLDKVATRMGELHRPIRIRVPLQLWNGSVYMAWRGEVWKAEVADVAEARELNLALEKFFEALGRVGAPAVFAALEAAVQAPDVLPVINRGCEPEGD